MMGVLEKIKNILDPNQRELKKLQKWVDRVNLFSESTEALSDDELKKKTQYFKEQLASGQTLDDILSEAFSVVREVSKRTIKLRPYDVQVLGGVVLHQGRIAEMKTGEGKTLVAAMPLYLNALAGKGAHLVTVNDYLAKRDARWMGPIYHFLGLSVGIIQHDQAFIFDPDYIVGDESMDQLRRVSRREAYSADITYGTNNEYGFDYLRDNMVMEINERVQRELNYAIVDEVDSILIDEARTPLIISGRGKQSSDNYRKFARIAAGLKPEKDYVVFEKERNVSLTDEGIANVERQLGLSANETDEDEVHPLYAPENSDLLHYLEAALKAKELFKLDVDYVLKDGEVIIIDEFTGRPMFGRRYSDGIHQSIEAKENVKVRSEDQTLATITFQNYFRMYGKLAGMTGTAATEEKEFREIYNVDVVIIPTHRTIARQDMDDRVYKSEATKFKAIINEIVENNGMGRPVLVGTRSIEMSELLSSMLKKKNIPHNVLNAKHHEKEAQIIAQAGKSGAVTIATNMAGRGVDIILGGALPTSEKEKRIYNSAVAHLEKMREDLEELKNKIENNKTEIEKTEKEFEESKNRIQELSKLCKEKESEELVNQIEEETNRNQELKNKLSRMRDESVEFGQAIKGHEELIPSLQEKVDKAEEDFERKEAEVVKEMKLWEEEHDKVIQAGGLAVIGSERHESRRIDNQLRGRSGRQGDPGATRFYTSMEDELMRLFGSDRLPDWLTSWEDNEDMPIEMGLITSSIRRAQEKVESYHFDIRKNVLNYDNVMNEQRRIIYGERDRIIRGEDLKPHMVEFIEEYVDNLVSLHAPEELIFEEWDMGTLYQLCKETFIPLPFDAKVSDLAIPERREIRDKVLDWAMYAYEEKEKKLGEDLARAVERWLMLQILDNKWMDHLQTMDDLRDGIGLRAYGQRDPLIEYIKESNEYFEAMKDSLKEDTLKTFFRVQVKSEGIQEKARRSTQVTREHRGSEQAGYRSSAGADGQGTTVRKAPKVGRNETCPCGSGKKYKKCCGRNE
jgi:preprotein translocase subunit SecA